MQCTLYSHASLMKASYSIRLAGHKSTTRLLQLGLTHCICLCVLVDDCYSKSCVMPICQTVIVRMHRKEAMICESEISLSFSDAATNTFPACHSTSFNYQPLLWGSRIKRVISGLVCQQNLKAVIRSSDLSQLGGLRPRAGRL